MSDPNPPRDTTTDGTTSSSNEVEAPTPPSLEPYTAHYPKWAQELARKYFTKTIAAFIVHGDIRDVVPTEDPEGNRIYPPLRDFLTDDLFAARDVVIFYDRSAGIHFADDASKNDFQRALSGHDTVFGTNYQNNLPKDPPRVFALLENYFRLRLADGKRIACIIDYAETIVPMAEASMYSPEDRASLVFLQIVTARYLGYRPFSDVRLARVLAVALLLWSGSATAVATPAPPASPLQQLFLLKEIAPNTQRIGVVWTESSPEHELLMKQLNQASKATQIEVVVAYAEGVADVATAFRSLTREHDVDAIWVLEEVGPMSDGLSRTFLIKNAIKSELPLLAPSDEWVREGAALSMRIADGQMQLVANESVCGAMSLNIPEKYLQQTQYLTSN